MYTFFLLWIFVQAMLIKTNKQNQKEESRGKAKKIIVTRSFKFQFCFPVFKCILKLWFFEFPWKIDSCQYFSQTFKKYLNQKYLIVLGNIHMFKVFRGLWKKIVFSFMKNIWGVTKKVVWNIVLFCQMITF